MSIVDALFGPILDMVRAEARRMLSELESDAQRAIDRIVRSVRYTFTEVLLWSFASVFLLAGVLIFLMRFFPADGVLIGTAVLMGYLALLVRMRR